MALQRITHAGAAPPTGLSGAINNSVLTFTLVSGTGYPTGSGGPFVLVLDPGTPSEEKVLCSSLAGATVTVATGGRGWDGTAATSHGSGTTNVAHVFSANEADDANAHIYVTTRNDHTQYLTGITHQVALGSNVSLPGTTTTTVLSINGVAGRYYYVTWHMTLSEGVSDPTNVIVGWLNDNINPATNASGTVQVQGDGGWGTVGGSVIWQCQSGNTTLQLLAYSYSGHAVVQAAGPNGAGGATSITMLDLGTIGPS